MKRIALSLEEARRDLVVLEQQLKREEERLVRGHQDIGYMELRDRMRALERLQGEIRKARGAIKRREKREGY